jgi:tetratricopeptide (TPR) repeat protein
LTAAQLEAYLKTNGRSAASLLAAFRTSQNQLLLEEAMQKFPNDPQVDFEAACRNLSPEEHRRWLDAFKRSAPENALANYFSALDYFKSGQTDQAVQEFMAASGKPFQDYRLDRLQADEEAYREAGYSVAEAKAFSSSQLMLPQLGQMKAAALQMVDLANSYRQAGDENSAQAALQMAASVGQRYGNGMAGESLSDQFVGLAIQRNALSAMNPTSPYGGNGQTVQDRLNELLQQRTMLKELDQQFQSVQAKLSTQDWISYVDRCRTFGHVAGMQWAISKYNQQ